MRTVRRIAGRGCARLLACLSSFGLILPALRAADYFVDTPAQFTAQVDKNGLSFSTLRAGDRVFLKGGTWSGMVGTLRGSMTDDQAQSNPARVLACDENYQPTVGGVVVAGLTQVQLQGSGVVFGGVTFGPQSGLLQVGAFTDYSDEDPAWMIRCRPGSRYMTLSHLRFDHPGRENTEAGNDHYGANLQVTGYRHTIQYCEFEGRDLDPVEPAKSSRGALVTFSKSSSDTDYGQHVVRYCYFGPRAAPISGDPALYVPADGSSISTMGNGWETVRIGDSGAMELDLAVVVEHCVFDRSITSPYGDPDDAVSEPEIISSKSRRNVYRYNTFLTTYGQICFRSGDYSVAHGNVFLNGGAYDAAGDIVLTAPTNNRMSGVRVFGFGNVITNNYFYRLNGSGLTAALCFGAGDTDPGTADALRNIPQHSYESANYTHVAGNTFIDCKVLTFAQPSSSGSITPGSTRFLNNLVTHTGDIGATGVTGHTTDPIADYDGLATGNYFYSPAAAQFGSGPTMLGTDGNTFTTAVDPLLADTYGPLLAPAAASPVLGQAAGIPAVDDNSSTAPNYQLAGLVQAFTALDMRGLVRPSTGRDIGAFEREASGTGAQPLRRTEVGRVDASYPISSDASPVIITTTLPAGRADTAYLATTLGAVGGVRPLTWSVVSGALPAGLVLNSATGSLTGTPSSAGDYTFTVRASAADGAFAQQNYFVPVGGTDSPLVVVSDAVSDAERATQAPPVSLAWFSSSSASTLTVTGGALKLDTGGTGGRHAIAYFPVQDVPLGATLSLDFDFNATEPVDFANGLRFGLFNRNGSTTFTADASNTAVTYTGYAVFTNFAPTTNNPTTFRQRTDATASPLITSTTSYSPALGTGAGGPQQDFTAKEWYHARLSLERTGLDEMTLTVTYTGADLTEYTLTRTDTGIVSSFDAVVIAIYGAGGTLGARTLTADNVTIAYTPPPPTPIVAVAPVGDVVRAGGSATLQVTAASPTPLSYQWRKDGAPLAGATGSELTLTDLQLGDGGLYDVVLINAAGVVTSPAAELSVVSLDPAALPAQNLDLSHWNITVALPDTDGEATTVSPADLASYSSELFYTDPSTGATVFIVPHDGAVTGTSSSPRTELRELLDPDSALVNWFADGTHILDAICEVNALPPGNRVAIGQIHGKNYNIPLVILTYEATATGGMLTATVKHQRDDAPIPGTTSRGYTFSFGDVPLDRPIRYRLMVQDGVVSITVNGVTASKDLYALANGWEEVDFYFKAGAYYVGRTTPAPTQVSFYAVEVQHSPHLAVTPVAQTVTAGGSVTWSVAPHGSGPFTYQWFKDGEPVEGAAGASFTLAPAWVADAGSYSVMVSNDLGSITTPAALLTVEPAPAEIAFLDLVQAYDGTPRLVATTTTPAGLPVVVTYDGATNAPTLPGTYALTGTISDPNYVGSATGTLYIETAALVRQAPVVNGVIEGSIAMTNGESVALNTTATIDGDLLVPGLPAVTLNGQPTYAGTLDATGATSPGSYSITLNSGAVLRHVVRRVDPLEMPVVTAPAAPAGTRVVSLNGANQSPGDFATLRDLTLNTGSAPVSVPPGAYGSFTINSGTVLVLGIDGAVTPAAYSLQALALNGGGRIEIAGPVLLTVGEGVTVNGAAGNTDHSRWLALQVHDGGLTVNSGASLAGRVIAPAGTVTINGTGRLAGGVVADGLVLNSGALLEQATP